MLVNKTLEISIVTILLSVAALTMINIKDSRAKDVTYGIFEDIANQEITRAIDDWMNDHNIKRVEIELDMSSEGKPEYDVLTVQPLFQSGDSKHTFFTQGRLAYGNDSRTTTNIGFGYRRLALDNKLLIGLNSFHDYEWPYNHQRVGFGLEIKSSAFQLNTNIYEGITEWHSADSGAQERALNGADIEIGSQVPYLPWAYVFYKKFFWDGSDTSNVDGQSYSVRLRPTPLLEIEAGHTDDNSTSQSSEFVQVKARLNWGSKSKSKMALIDDQAFRMDQSMEDRVLTKVRRENTIRVERSASSGNVTMSMARGT